MALAQEPSDPGLALRCVLDGVVWNLGDVFAAGPGLQTERALQLARFLDGQTSADPKAVSLLLRPLQGEAPARRRRFFESLAACRRRGGVTLWRERPVAQALNLPTVRPCIAARLFILNPL